MVLCKYYRVASVIDDAGIQSNKDVKDGGKLTEPYSHPPPPDGSSVLPPNKHTHSHTRAPAPPKLFQIAPFCCVVYLSKNAQISTIL